MIIVSSREFRDNQKKYFDLSDKNEQIIIQRGKDKSYKLVPILEEEIIVSKEVFIEKIKTSLKQAKEGKTTQFDGIESFKKFLEK